MDTELDIRRDRYEEEHKGCCGTCWFRGKVKGQPYFCDNLDSEMNGEFVGDENGCDEWTAR